jgi:hypothetical protein
MAAKLKANGVAWHGETKKMALRRRRNGLGANAMAISSAAYQSARRGVSSIIM